MFFLEIWSNFKKFDLRQLHESIYSGTEGVHCNDVGIISKGQIQIKNYEKLEMN